MVSPELLRRFSLFADLDPGIYEELAAASKETLLKTGEWLFMEGDDADALYLVLEGKIDLKVNLDPKGQRQQNVSTVAEGHMMGWSALVEPYIYTLSAVAVADCRLVSLEASAVRDIMERNPEIGYTIMKRLAKAIGARLANLRVQIANLTKT
jgi:CRP/FNR family cyclic AMP-dependent transcriptional regulator